MKGAGIRLLDAPVELIELDEPRPLADDEVLLEVKAAGVGTWDQFARNGHWKVGTRPPMALGVEAAGTVLAMGRSVAGWSRGDAVMTHPLPLRDQGTWAPSLIAPAALLAPKPTHAAWEEAAAFPVPALTAEQVVADTLGLEAGEDLLVNGAGGVTGGLLVAIGRLRGARVIATASPSSAERVRALGARDVIDYHDPEWPEQVRAITRGHGVAAAANAAPGRAATAIRAVADGGRLATITGDPPSAERHITVTDFYIHADGDQLRRLARSFDDRELGIPVASRYPLAQAAEAYAEATRGHAAGAIVLTF